MPDGISVQVEGFRELEKNMKAMGNDMALKSMRSALVAGAQVIRDEAKARAIVKTGTMLKSIYMKKLTKPNPFKENVIVGVRSGRGMWKKVKGLLGTTFDKSKDAFYWRFIEFGHKDRAGKDVAAHPFIRPAFEARKYYALERIKEVLREKIKQFTRTRVVRYRFLDNPKWKKPTA